MPFVVAGMLEANAALHPREGFAPDFILEAIEGAETVLEAMEAGGFVDVLDEQRAAELKAFLGSIPPALDAAMLAGARSALRRGLRTQLSWQPGYDFELRTWEASQEVDGTWEGLLNIHLVSPHPDEAGSTA